MKLRLVSLFMLFGSIVGAAEPPQGSRLKWRTEFILETTPKGAREVGLVIVFQDGQQIGQLDPRNLQLPGEDWDEADLKELSDYYSPGVTGEPRIIALSPDEKRLVFFVEIIPDHFSKYILYFDTVTRKIIPLGKVCCNEFEGFSYGPNPEYAYLKSEYLFVAMNFKTNTVQQIPSLEEALGSASIPPDVVVVSDGTWLQPNLLSFTFHQEICQNPGTDINQVERIFSSLPEKTCTYNFDTGEVHIKESVPAFSAQNTKATGAAKTQAVVGKKTLPKSKAKSKKKSTAH